MEYCARAAPAFPRSAENRDGYDFAKDERDRAEFLETLKFVLAGSIPIPDYWHTPSDERRGAVIAGVLHNQKRFVESGIVAPSGC
jgi:alpha-galactosidase